MYIVNGKIYTDAPLMDEIVYNCKLILKDIVVKNEKLALQYETEETINAAELRVLCISRNIAFLNFPWTVTILSAFGYSPEEAQQYKNNPNLIPMEDRDELLEFAEDYVVDNYIEKNKYYRSLMGLPEYGTEEYYIYLQPSDFPPDFDTELIDFSLPVHEYPKYIIEMLQSSGMIDQLIEKYRSFNYSYLRYLGTKSISIDESRPANKWDILYIPPANADVSYRFQELYEKNKYTYLNRFYQDAYAFSSEYYDNMMIVLLLAQTFNDMIVDVPEWYIRKDVFDIRTVQYFLEAYNVPFFKEIPLKYQIKIVKSLNKLIMSKSTIENFNDILDIFSLRETHVYRYYLYKKHKKDAQSHFIIDDDPTKMYDLEFIEVLLGDTYDNYIKDISARIPYDEITSMDEYWDGGQDHDEVKLQMLEKDFIIEPTKYITIKADIVYPDYQKQLAYFLSTILDTRMATDDIYISVPSISESVKFSLTNLILFIECLCHLYYKTDNSIIKPEDKDEPVTEELPDFEPSNLPDEWWMKDHIGIKNYSELFTDNAKHRVYGFNPNVDMDYIQSILDKTHEFTNYTLGNFATTIEDLYLNNYIVPPERFYTIESLMDFYDNNIKCMEKLQFDLLHNMENKDQQKIYQHIFNEVYTKDYDYNFAGENQTLDQVLLNRDYTLYRLYKELKIKQDTDPESAGNDIDAILADIVSVLSFYFNRPSLDYLFALVSNTSFESILRYIYLMLNAFKSYKLHFINPITKYIGNTPSMILGNNMDMFDTIKEHTSEFYKPDIMHMWDMFTFYVTKIQVEDYFREKLFEILDVYTKVQLDPDDDYVYDGGGANTTNYTKLADGGGAEESIPFKTLYGAKSYMLNIDNWNLDFNGAFLHEFNEPITIDGGNVLDGVLNGEIDYYSNFFKNIYNSGSINSDKLVNNNFFVRIIDNQTDIKAMVATRTGYQFEQDLTTGTITLREIWREWRNINDFEILNDVNLISSLYDESTMDIWVQIHDNHELPYGDEYTDLLDNENRRIYLYELDNLMNRTINITIEDMYTEGNNRTEADWDFGELPDDEGNVPGDCNFGELPDDPGNMIDNYEFGEISNIIYITKLGNYDTSRVITIPRDEINV